MRSWIHVFAAGVLFATAAGAQGKLEPGEWERTTSSDVPGMYTGPIVDTSRECFTSADQKIYADKDAWSADMVAATAEQKCKAKDLKQEGTALSVTLVCSDGIRMDLRHDFRDTTGTIDAQVWNGDEAGTKTHIELKRVAEKCSEETIDSWKRLHPGKEFQP
jgi:hypothetical protein